MRRAAHSDLRKDLRKFGWSWGSQWPIYEPTFSSYGHTRGSQEALEQVGKPQPREQEPGRFQSGLEFTQLTCKSHANLPSLFLSPLFLKSRSFGRNLPLPPWSLLASPLSVCQSTHPSISTKKLQTLSAPCLPEKDFPSLDESPKYRWRKRGLKRLRYFPLL